MPARSPERLIAVCFEARSGQEYLGAAPQMEREVFHSLHEWGRLDDEERVVILGGIAGNLVCATVWPTGRQLKP